MPAALQSSPPPLSPAPPGGTLDMTNQTENATVTAERSKPFSPPELKQKYDETEDKLDAINQSTGALQPPKFDMPKAPEPKQTDAMQVWGSAAMTLAAVGSLLTRQPLTTAMNAAASVMKAAKANDMEEAKQQFEVWKANSELAIKQQNFQMEAYKAALSKASTDSRTAIAEFTAYAHAFGDNTAVEVAKQRHVDAVERLLADRDKQFERMQEKMPDIIKAKEFTVAFKSPEFQKKLSEAKSPEEKMGLIAGLTSGMSQEDMDFSSQQRLAGDTTAYQNQGRGKDGAARLAAMQANTARLARQQGLTGADLASRDAAFQGIKAGFRTVDITAARIGLGVAELQKLEPQVRQASEALKRSGYPTLNAWLQAAQREGGSPELKGLAVRLQGLKSAFSQVLTRGGVPTDSARATTDELFSTKDPNGVMEAALSAMNSEAGAIEQAPGVVRDKLSASITDENLPQITSQAAYDALPSGKKTPYMEDGKKYYKP